MKIKQLLVLMMAIALNITSYANDSSSEWDIADGASLVSGSIIVGGGVALADAALVAKTGYTLGPVAVPAILVAASGVAGYGVGKVIRGVDNATGKNIYNFIYTVGDKTKIFEAIRLVETKTKEEFQELVELVNR